MATLLPLAWAIVTWVWRRFGSAQSGRARVGWGLALAVAFAVEGAGTYALVRTYSRGALAGLAAGALVWMALAGMGRWRRQRVERSAEWGAAGGWAERDPGLRPGEREPRWFVASLPWVARAVLVAGLIGFTGFSARIAPEHIAEDRSSLNRLVLWKGGAELVAASPLRGWGWGESGAAFMHWSQPLDRREGYLSMVNSYLTVAVEAGLPWFTVLCAALLLPLGLSVVVVLRGRPRKTAMEPVQHAAVAMWAVWLGCLFFSNLWIIRSLWVVPGLAAVAALVFLSLAGGWRVWRTGVVAALLAAAGASGLLWAAGQYWSGQAGLVFTREADGSILVARAQPVSAPEARGAESRIVVVPDVEVLGESFGQEVRRWLLAEDGPDALRVVRSAGQITPRHLDGASGVVFCGAAASGAMDLADLADAIPVWLLHPTLAPPQTSPSWSAGSRVNVPGIDIGGQAAAWWEWAARAPSPLPVRVSQGLAVDVRPRWPDLTEGFGTRD